MSRTLTKGKGADIVKNIIERLERLERSPRLGQSSLLEGALKILDRAGLTRVMLGDLDEEGVQEHYGIKVLSEAGQRLLNVDERGMIAPSIGYPTVPDISTGGEGAWGEVAVSAGSFVTCHATWVDRLCHPAFRVNVFWTIDAGCVGEFRICQLGGVTSSAVSTGGALSGTTLFAWLHQLLIGTGIYQFGIQARVTSGVGNIRIFPPVGGFMATGPENCTTTGL